MKLQNFKAQTSHTQQFKEHVNDETKLHDFYDDVIGIADENHVF
jgi:hypothetical protein